MTNPWWRHAVVYEIYVRSFADGNGDGIGDLPGATAHLADLARLGVDAVWLTPFYPSPMADGGYDVADPMGVDPMFGDLADFEDFVATAHDLGLRVIVDLVPNHSSSEHPWFRAAVEEKDPVARARYFFRDRNPDGSLPNNWPSHFGGPAWTQEPNGDQVYLHLFAPEQPDLNWRNPDVPALYEKVLRCWLDRGVDGFRIDVAHGLLKQADLADLPVDVARDPVGTPGLPMWDQPEVHDVYRDWRALVDSYGSDRMLVGEVYLFDQNRAAEYLGPEGLNQAFDFTLQLQPFEADTLGTTILHALQVFSRAGSLPTWVLSNHDLVRAATRFGGGQEGRERALAALSLVLGLPGAPYLYQGDELAALQVDVPPEVRQDPMWERSRHTMTGRDGCRTPLPWTAANPGHGFTTGTPWLPFAPDAEMVNVQEQQDDPTSPWAVVQELLTLRRRLQPHLGETAARVPAPAGVLVLKRDGKPGIVLALNTTDEPVQVEGLTDLLAGAGEGGLLPARSCSWFGG